MITVEFSAEMHFGKIGNSKEIIVKTAIGFSPINPASFYFYGNINRLTLGSIAEAFDFNIALPKVILDTGFPDGLVVGFTLNPKGNFNFISLKLFYLIVENVLLKIQTTSF